MVTALADQLARVSLFADLTPGEFVELASLLRVRSYPKGRILFGEGDSGAHLYFVAAGLTSIVLAATTALADTPTTTATTGATRTPRMTVGAATATPTPTATAVTGTPTATATAGTGTPTPTGTAPTATPTASGTPGTVTPTPTSSVAHDTRYFSQTSYRIDNNTIWDYSTGAGAL